jgi:hypothetical protein
MLNFRHFLFVVNLSNSVLYLPSFTVLFLSGVRLQLHNVLVGQCLKLCSWLDNIENVIFLNNICSNVLIFPYLKQCSCVANFFDSVIFWTIFLQQCLWSLGHNICSSVPASAPVLLFGHHRKQCSSFGHIVHQCPCWDSFCSSALFLELFPRSYWSLLVAVLMAGHYLQQCSCLVNICSRFQVWQNKGIKS